MMILGASSFDPSINSIVQESVDSNFVGPAHRTYDELLNNTQKLPAYL